MMIGVLSVQGAFIEHRKILEKLQADSVELRSLADIQRPLDGLILPGGESTVMGKLLRELHMLEPLRKLIIGGLPVLGTCAGMILMAKEISGGEPPHLRTMDISVLRGAYGRQLGSFHANAPFDDKGLLPLTFIRAPVIEHTEPDVEILCRVDGRMVAARQGNQLATAFHPELTEDTTVHEMFLELARYRQAGTTKANSRSF